MSTLLKSSLVLICFVAAHSSQAAEAEGFVPLFPHEGAPAGWRVTHWANVNDPPPQDARWIVKDGVLQGSTPRGTWLVSEREYGDFLLEFEFRLDHKGNSGVGLRFPAAGDPAFDGLELQMVDPRYYGAEQMPPEELTGSLYKAVAPLKQAYKPTHWNKYEITCRGAHVSVRLNGELIQQVNLDGQTAMLERGLPLKDRPRRGHIGFQELSRGGGHVEIRGARIKELTP
jgi:hypothetical protein